MSTGASTITVLDPLTARMIAAGEVIERPSGVIRELLDNSLDAGAASIEVDVCGGGLTAVRVSDDGAGMSKADLELCVLSHATSKIRSADDLLRVRTLGFRGEALSSIAAVSRLTITSAQGDSTPYRLRVDAGTVVALEASAGTRGTTVDMADLFFNVPARKSFQKRPSSEAAACRALFLEKAVAFPGISFRLRLEGELRDYLPPGSAIDRIVAAFPERTDPARLSELTGGGPGFTLSLVAGEPSSPRRDRKNLMVYVNRRRVWEYALVQAIEYAYSDYLHGGYYPTAYLFVDIEPELVDFNVHPTKREVRLRNLPEIHRAVVATLSGYLRRFDRRSALVSEPLPFYAQDSSPTAGGSPSPDYPAVSGYAGRADLGGFNRSASPPPTGRYDLDRTLELGRSVSPTTATPPEDGRPRYLGQLFGLFLLVEHGATLYLIDQHAAHERIIYDRLRTSGAGQELLFPVRIEVDEAEERALREHLDVLEAAGVRVESRDGAPELTTLPAGIDIGAEEFATLLLELLERPKEFERELYASLACRAAVKDGDPLSDRTAHAIIDGVLGLEHATCPHGRPIWVALDRDQLASMVGRT